MARTNRNRLPVVYRELVLTDELMQFNETAQRLKIETFFPIWRLDLLRLVEVKAVADKTAIGPGLIFETAKKDLPSSQQKFLDHIPVLGVSRAIVRRRKGIMLNVGYHDDLRNERQAILNNFADINPAGALHRKFREFKWLVPFGVTNVPTSPSALQALNEAAPETISLAPVKID